MKEIKNIHDFIRFVLKKSRSGYLSPEEIDSTVNRASIDRWNKYTGDIADYQKGASFSPVNPTSSQKVIDRLRVFDRKSVITITSGTGSIPSNYGILDMCSFFPTNISEGVEVRHINKGKWQDRIQKKVSTPTESNPVFMIHQETIEVRPKTIKEVELYYKKKPVSAVYAYTYDADNYPVYEDGPSVDIEWGIEEHNEIITGALVYLGMNLSDAQAVSYSESRKQQGK